jgi:hypothetical protein
MASKPATKQDLRTVHPEYAAASDKLNELHKRSAELTALIRPLSEEAARTQVSWVAQSPKHKPKPVERHAGAAALLGDLLPPLTPEELDPPPPRPSWPGEAELRALGAENEAIHEAIKLLQPVWARARAQGSKKVCERRMPEYRQLVANLVAAAKQFGDVLLEHHEFVDEIRRQGASWSFLRPLNLESFGSLDGNSPVTRMIVEAIENGHVPSVEEFFACAESAEPARPLPFTIVRNDISPCEFMGLNRQPNQEQDNESE